jgi:mono/diheme cytochrome c family protein
MLMFSQGFHVSAQNSGKDLFQSNCAACHKINGGKMIGPDLGGVNERREQDWLIRFIRASQKMVSAGDPVAVALFEEYNKVPMPDNNYSDSEILSILSYIKEAGGGASASKVTTAQQVPDTARQAATVSYSSEQRKRGSALFYGYERFKNGASSCMVCHFINDESILGGGKLSFDLTGAYGRLGAAGIQAILTNPPFPAMNRALLNKNLTADEKEAITAMLQFVNDQYAGRAQPLKGGVIFLVLGLVFALFLLVHLYVFYDYRKLPS